MRLCFIVDYRSPIARNWIDHFVTGGNEVHVISTFPAAGVPAEVAGYHECTIGLTGLTTSTRLRGLMAINGAVGSRAAVQSGGESTATKSATRTTDVPVRQSRGWRAGLRQRANSLATELLAWSTPLEARARASSVAAIVRGIRPDLVHAMRVPYEGMLAAEALAGEPYPLVTSVWGNDFTLWAVKNPVIAAATRRTLRRTTALHTDCRRDRRMAEKYGWDPAKPAAVLPGSGGVQMDVFHPGDASDDLRRRWDLPEGRPVVVNPRAFRPSYVRNDTFFAAIPRVLAVRPDVLFAGVAMKDNPLAMRWCDELDIANAVRLLPPLTRTEMAELFRIATVSVSPSLHDGTPNTLLESMACGAFPVAGDIDSVREWIDDGENGLLCDPTDPAALAAAIIRALSDEALRQRARTHNRRLIEERVDYDVVMREAGRFYESLAGGQSGRRDGPETRHPRATTDATSVAAGAQHGS